MAQKYADLHIHTAASDGKSTPEEVIRQAHDAGLAAVGIADHDSVDGVRLSLEVGERLGVEVIPGVELSSEIGETEVHIIGYFIDWNDRKFGTLLKIIQGVRLLRAEVIVAKLQKLGISISFDEVLAEAESGSIGRPHIVRVLLKRGHVKTVEEAFERYLKHGRPAYVGKYRIDPVEAIDIIRGLKGVPVLAHPIFSNIGEEKFSELVKSGLKGIEAYHSRHDEATTKNYEELAKKYGLIVTGGSDSHGLEDPIGCVRVPYEVVEQLRAEHRLLSEAAGGLTREVIS